MKKILALFVAVFALSSCFKSETFKGKEYKLLNTDGKVRITIGFDKEENRFYGSVVNRYFGTYTVDGNKITFSPAGSTMMAGPQMEMMVEKQYLELLPTIQTFKFEDGDIVFTTDKDEILTFVEITPEENTPAATEETKTEEPAPAAEAPKAEETAPKTEETTAK